MARATACGYRVALGLVLLLAALSSPAAALVSRVGMPLARHASAVHSRCVALAADAEKPAKAEKVEVPTLNKSDLVSRIASKTGVTKKVANDVLSATMDSIVESVCEGNKVMLVGFGSFAPKSLPAREGRNPRTGEKLQIQASRVPAFSVAKTFKERVNASKGS